MKPQIILPIIMILGLVFWLVTPRTTTIAGFIVSHHDFVKGQRDRLYQMVAEKIKPPKTIILLSPNHYNTGAGQIQSSSQVWQVTNGTITPDLKVLASLRDIGVSEEPSSFQGEHGVYLQLANIQKSFPNSKLVPLIIKSTTPYAKIEQLEEKLNQVCHNCLLIASVDFSHYQPAILAELHDQQVERYLFQSDAQNLYDKAETNCSACLAGLALWAKDHDTNQFHIRDHTNSGLLLADQDIETTTHFFGWYQAGPPIVPENNVSFIFGGNTVEIADMPNAFSQLGERTFWGSDGSFLQLTNHLTKPLVDILKTQKLSQPVDNDFATITGHNLTLKVFKIDADTDIETIIGRITTLISEPQNRIVIFSSDNIPTDLAHVLIDAGAHLVIGSSPTLEAGEVYHDRPILYSLGSFLSSSLQSGGYLLAGKFTNDQLQLFVLPTSAKNHQPYLVRGESKQTALADFYQPFVKFLQNTPAGQILVFPEK